MIDHITRLRAEAAGLPAAESREYPPLVCFPMRLDWEMTQPDAEREPFPAPLQPAQVMPIETWPQPVEKLAAHAALFGWAFDVRRAEGFTPHASYGTPSARSKVLWSLRLARGEERAVAVRTDSSWTSLWHWSQTRLMTRIELLDVFYGVLGVAVDGQQ